MQRALVNFAGVLLLIVVLAPWGFLIADTFLWMFTNSFVIAQWVGITYTPPRVFLMIAWPVACFIALGIFGGGFS